MESTPNLRKRWRDAQPTKTMLFWACVVSAVLTMVIGFYWLGWMSAGDAQAAAEAMSRDAVVQRLVPICVAQFNQDPDKSLKLVEMSEKGAYQQGQFVQDQGWATISGVDKPDRKVADACTKLLLEMSP